MTLSWVAFVLFLECAFLVGLLLGCYIAARHELDKQEELAIFVTFTDDRDPNDPRTILAHELADPDLAAWEQELTE